MYKLYQKIDTGIVRMTGNGLCQMWLIGSKGLLKPHTCANCKRTIEKGEKAYHPLTNGNNRSHRICLDCMKSEETSD